MCQLPNSQTINSLKKSKSPIFQQVIKQLQKKKPGLTDKMMHDLHEEISSKYDCLQCANCCKSISPMLNKTDLERLAKAHRLSVSRFSDLYLHYDEDDDMVFNDTPCPFLQENNYCAYYEQRPKACREYPHTDRKNMKQILPLTLKNAFVCPIVFGILERLSEELL